MGFFDNPEKDSLRIYFWLLFLFHLFWSLQFYVCWPFCLWFPYTIFFHFPTVCAQVCLTHHPFIICGINSILSCVQDKFNSTPVSLLEILPILGTISFSHNAFEFLISIFLPLWVFEIHSLKAWLLSKETEQLLVSIVGGVWKGKVKADLVLFSGKRPAILSVFFFSRSITSYIDKIKIKDIFKSPYNK